MIRGFRNLTDLPAEHNIMHENLFSQAQAVIDKKFTTVPTTDEVPPFYFAYYDDGTNQRIYINFYGTMKYFDLT